MKLMDEEWKCSRFSYSYPQIVQQALGSSVKNFQYFACSGHRTDGIEEQAKKLEGDLDLVVLTAGGNDLCLAGMIKDCVFLPWSESACEKVLSKAQSNINNILKPNIRSVLDALEDKMRKDSIVVYNGYAPFFNTENEDCSTKQRWALLEWAFTSYAGTPAIPLSVERRKRFNALVEDINKAISEVVAEYDGKKKYRIAYSDWSEWPAIVDGQMCSPTDDTGKYPNEKQPMMQFFKPDTHLPVAVHDEFKRSEITSSVGILDNITLPDENLYDSILYKSPNPPVVALDRLENRANLAPNCPGDGTLGLPWGIGLPDSFLCNFHPNMKGHETIAASTLETIALMRAKILGKNPCPITIEDEFKCWSSDGLDWPRPYAGWERLDKSYKEFCENLKPPADTVNWQREQDYNVGTIEEHKYKVKLNNDASQFSKNECLDSFKKLIFSCDTDKGESNPMGWKYGGRYVRGSTTYELYPKWERPTHKRADGECSYKNQWLRYEYNLQGKGWAGWDNGKETLLPALKGCKLLTPTSFEFGYCAPKGDHKCGDNNDWWATFFTTIGVNGRCMDNQNVVAKSAGGHFHKWKESGGNYDDVGCSEL
ncbi:hypothetical protein KVR01_002886 [Diaporthe batatas]|uniref:uncharacterized protein n=1 Tax=Diaporthe batatas TaxID=748121 RepID=UPI001D052F7C|nr:uncharacterized protein KVR01_002886 [Diaporthe batatas]KAG8167197.1 hypothetical protein KVR01_002886 [Diaporthe batatas]